MPHTEEELLSLSPEQRALQPQGPALVLRAALQGAVDEHRLHRALTELVMRHESLHTAYRHLPGTRSLRQRVLPQSPLPQWRSMDLRGRPDAADRVAELAAAEAHGAFDLAHGRTVRALLVRQGDDAWQLVLAVSCLAADRGSLLTLLDELLRLHAGMAVGAEVFPYSQYVRWRDALQADADAVDARAYWADMGLDTLAAPRLPYRDAAGGGQPDLHSVDMSVDASLAEAVERCAQAHGVANETLLQGAWWLLLARISGEPAFAGAWQHDCRRDYDSMAGGTGVYDKLLPLPLQVDPAQFCGAWLRALDQRLQAHCSWQEGFVPANDSVAAWRIGFACVTLPVSIEHGPLRAEVLQLPEILPGLELALQPLLDRDGRLQRVALHADAGRYDEMAARCLLSQVLALLGSMVASPDATIGDLGMTGATQALWLLEGPVLDVGTESLPALLTRQAAATPDAPALAGRGVTLSYGELDRHVERLSQALAARGVGAESVVALQLPRSVDLVLALLAVQRAGGAYLPLDPDWPVERRRQILADAKPLLRVGERDDADGIALRTLEAQAPSTGRPLPAVELQQAAYLLYTSGSTGTPKGVVIEHRHLLNYAAAASQALGLSRCRRFALTSTVAADLGNTTLYGAFFSGGCLVVADADDMRDAASFADFMRREAIDCLKIVPSHLEALLDTEAPLLPRTLVLGGEATPRALVERIEALAPHCRIFNHYGPTETTVGVMVHARQAQERWAADTLPLSRPLANCRVLLLDAQRRAVPTGAIGELYIGGSQLARGVLSRQEAALFIDDPFRPGERLYRTGDLARCLPDGRVLLLGRADDELKIRGFRIAPAEIEAALLGLPGVRQAAVQAAGEGASKQLYAYVVCETGEAQLLAALRLRLPEPMLPTRCVVLAALPRLPNGKIDRQALRPPQAESTAQTFVAPRNDLEAVLAALYSELLAREPIGVHDSFFDLGGHSLLVIKLVARIRRQLHVDIPPGAVFDHASVAALAEALRRRAERPAELDRLAALRRHFASLSAQQQQALLEQARNPASIAAHSTASR